MPAAAPKKGRTIIRLVVRKPTDTPAAASRPARPAKAPAARTRTPTPVPTESTAPKAAAKAAPKVAPAAGISKKAAGRQKTGRMITASERALCEHVVKGMGLFGLKSET